MNILIIVIISILTFFPFVLFIKYLYKLLFKIKKQEKQIIESKKAIKSTLLDGTWEREQTDEHTWSIGVYGDKGFLFGVSGGCIWFKIENIILKLGKEVIFQDIIQIENLKWKCKEKYIDDKNNVNWRDSIIIMDDDKERFCVYNELNEMLDSYIYNSGKYQAPSKLHLNRHRNVGDVC